MKTSHGNPLLEHSILNISEHRFLSRFTDDFDEFVHSHEFFEIVFINYGSIQHRTGNHVCEMQAGDAFVLAPRTQHTFIRYEDCAHRDVMLSVPLFKETCDYLDESFFDRVVEEKFIRFKLRPEEMETFENAYNAMNESDELHIQKAYEKLISCQLVGALYMNTQATPKSSSFKSKCSTFINEHYKEKDILENLRTELGYTQGHFCKKFKAEFQMTPTDYINRKRIISAAVGLALSNYSVEECCYSIGFDSVPHFINLFKEHYGVTPAKYRKTQKDFK